MGFDSKAYMKARFSYFDKEQGGLDCADPYGTFIGSYSWKFLCLPQWPYCRKVKRNPPPFFGVNQVISIFLSAVMGLQHALAMVGGLITPPLLVGALANSPATQQYMVSAGLIISGFFTLIHVVQFKIPFTKYVYGTGILSVVGVSFTFLENTQSSITILMAKGFTFDEAFGKLLGTMMVCCWIVVAMSFMPPRMLKRVFPPVVTGTVIFLIGAALIASAFKNWGGGAFCAENAKGLAPVAIGDCQERAANGTLIPATCFRAAIKPKCTGNGNVQLYFGAPEYIGLGFLTFSTLVFLEIFGSPFLRNSQVIIALLFGYMIAAVTTYKGQSYVNTAQIDRAPVITFLWTKTFPIGFYAPAVLPYLVSYMVTAVESIGDITATAEVSGLDTTLPEHKTRIQGGLLADGVNGFFGALATVMPTVTFAQNNGVVSITRCASRSAGVACALWLILLGIFSKVGAFFTSIPACVLGGITSFLFANVAVSGIKIITIGGLSRRVRFILSISIALGLGTALVPSWSSNNLWLKTPGMSSATEGFREACLLILKSGYSIGCVASILLHLILPNDAEPAGDVIRDLKGNIVENGPMDFDEDFSIAEKPVAMPPMTRDDTAHPKEAEKSPV